jgi:catechol 2,3-dioxygenase-like lactoylglutathione lyase family enzyme
MDRAVDFYSRVLTFEKVSEAEVADANYERLQGVFGARIRVVRMRLGDEFIELAEYIAPRGRPYPVDARSNDKSFQHIAIIVSDMDKAYKRLREFKVGHLSSGPQLLPEWNKNAGGISAFYFQDPDGHPLEVLHFPADKGAEKWHKTSDKLFLGIDHTAIVVDDTEASLRFYRDVLGMEVAGGAENYGTEQEHLNSVFGARLRITALRAREGFGIEFLEYLAPSDGRPFPDDERANDILHRQTTIETNDIDAVAKQLRINHAQLISPGVIDTADGALGFRRALLMRDPDGHPVLIEQR